MAKTVVAFELTANGQQAEGSVKSLKAQLKEAQNDVQVLSEKFGASSKAAIEAAKRAAQLKDAIGDAKALTDAFNPDRKFQAFSSAISGVVGGFSALQGAQALFGVESKDLEKTLLKVQAAMALSQGINSVLEARDSFKILKIVVVDAMRGIKAAIGSTGIGLLAVAIGSIVYAMKDWYDSTNKQVSAEELLKQKEEALRGEIKKTNDEIENRGKLNNYLAQVEITNAKARGASIQELRKIEDKFFTDEAIKRQDALDRELRNFAEIEKSYSKDSQIYKDALAQKDKIANDYYTFNQQRNQALANRQLEDYNNDVAKNKQRVDKIIADNKKIADANQAQNELQKKLQDEITLSLIQNERDRAATKLEMDLENAKKEVERTVANEKEKNESILLLERQFIINLRQMQDKWAEEDIAKIQEDAAKQAEINNEKRKLAYENEQKRIEDEKKAAEERIKIAEHEAQVKIDTQRAIADSFGMLSDVIGKETAVGKGFAVAQATINTWLGATEVLRAKSTLPEPIGTISKIINVAAIVASGIKSVKAILATKVPGGGGGGGTTPSLSQTNAPLTPQVQTTNLNQAQINQLASATTRAFVLESDVSGNQERIRRINRAARIN